MKLGNMFNRSRNLARLWISVGLFPLVAICQSPSPQGAAGADSKSVRPGINTEYLRPDINVNQWVERFEREGREVFEQREKIVQSASIKPGSAVADVGAGTGLFTTLLANAVGPQGTVYAVDIVPEFLKHIQNRIEKAQIKNVRTVLCTERSVELPPNSVDLVFLSDVYHHFEYPQSSLASIHKALRKNGQIFMVEFKRVPGVSSEWILNHVRAGQEEVTKEIEAAGFEKVEELNLLKENYVVRFRKK